MRRHPNPVLSRVKATETYVAISHELGVDLKRLFPSCHKPKGHILDKLFSSSAAGIALDCVASPWRPHWQWRNPSEFPVGLHVDCCLSSSSLADIMANVGWSNPNTASYYLKLEDIIRAGALSDRLASNLFTVDGVWFPLRLGLWLLLRMGVLHGVLC